MMAEERNRVEQAALPFAEADAALAGAWNDVSLALHRIGSKCDLHLSRFVRMVFDFTHGGIEGALTKSYRQLAERPAWLCCSERKARATVELAERLGLVSVERRRAWSGSQQENSYSINWPGVRGIVNGPKAPGTTRQGPGTTRHPHGTTCQGHGTTCRHTKEKKLYGSFLEEDYSGTGTGTGAVPNSTEKNPAQKAGRPRTAACGDGENDSLTDALVAQSPILSAAKERRIAPLPAGKLLHGVYAPINGDHLSRPLGFVKWHRQQLSTAVPVMGNSEADLLLTIAAVLYADSLRDGEVKKSRVGAFVHTISRRKFWRILPFVPRARTLLDEGIEYHGLTWAGLSDETAAAEEKQIAGAET